MKIVQIISALENNGVRCAIVGGYAVALHGVVRGTIDLDLVIQHTLDQFTRCEQALHSLGFVSRLPVNAKEVFNFRLEYIQNRNMLAWSFYKPNNPLEVVDIIITKDLIDIRSARIGDHPTQLPVISIEDLIQMKKEAGRPQDIEDLKLLEQMAHAKKTKA